jgi:hypothetical protein
VDVNKEVCVNQRAQASVRRKGGKQKDNTWRTRNDVIHIRIGLQLHTSGHRNGLAFVYLNRARSSEKHTGEREVHPSVVVEKRGLEHLPVLVGRGRKTEPQLRMLLVCVLHEGDRELGIRLCVVVNVVGKCDGVLVVQE